MIMYPPVNLKTIGLDHNRKGITSLGQFRPEKRHIFQLQILKHLDNMNPKYIIGSFRTQSESKYVQDLKEMNEKLSLKNVLFSLNASIEDIERMLANTRVGFHTMIGEHFGIAILEMLV